MNLPTAERIEPTEQAAAAPRLGDMLLSAQKLSRHDLERALEVQRSMGGKLGRLLVSLGLVAEADVFAALARQADLPLLRADAFPADRPETPALNTGFLLAHNLLPLGPALEGAEPPAFICVAASGRCICVSVALALRGFWHVSGRGLHAFQTHDQL